MIREKGALLGKIEFPDMPVEIEDPNRRHLVAEVSRKEVVVYGKDLTPVILAFDCGMKNNIIREFVYTHVSTIGHTVRDSSHCTFLLQHVCLVVVPHDYDLEANPSDIKYDGVFVSNGPGDPAMCTSTIRSIRWALALDPPKPIFGICLGNPPPPNRFGCLNHHLEIPPL